MAIFYKRSKILTYKRGGMVYATVPCKDKREAQKLIKQSQEPLQYIQIDYVYPYKA